MEHALYNVRIKARKDQQDREQKRKLAHAKVAALLKSKKEGVAVVAYAVKQVDKWRQHHLCSPDYIQAWSDLLLHPEEAARVLLEDSPRAVRLRQNTPFAAYLSR